MEIITIPNSVLQASTALDKFWQLHGSKDGYVQGRADWEIIGYCYELFALRYPTDLRIFVETQKRVRENLKFEHGNVEKASSSVEGQHMMNIPQKMYQLINTFYPNQKWEKPFVIELARKLPVLSVPKRI